MTPEQYNKWLFEKDYGKNYTVSMVSIHPTGEKKTFEVTEIVEGKKKKRRYTRMVYPPQKQFTVIKVA